MLSERMQRRIDALLDEADEAIAASDWARVLDRAANVLALDPGNSDAVSLTAAAQRALGSTAVPRSASSLTPPDTPAPDLPKSFAGGRYNVRHFLGEGGRKRVYLAHDTRLDRDVAVAIIKTEGLDAQGRSRVQREAQAMARLGDHQHIVTIHDVGEDGGQPYIVSQYMAGGAVAGLELPLPVERTLEIAKGVCRGLAHAHARDVVHRDLKPGNVWLAADGTAKIGDFGLAVALDRSRLTMAGMLVGTVAYMAPEQALGGETTPRADLYALGCMLYELVTGRPPFPGSDPTAVISQHINTPPVAPSWLTEACPPDLEELILRLLAKDPGERPASAEEVLAALERVDPAEKSASHSDSNVLDRLARGVFVGRERELERLRKAFDEAFAGHGGLVMLVGEPGIGKTRTTQELETYARMRGAQVLWGRTHESAGAPPYWPWVQAGNQYGTAHLDELASVIGPQLPPGAVGDLSRIFPWLKSLPNFVEPEAFSDPEIAQFRLFDAYTSYLRAIAGQAPLLVALDDLHWADKPTLQLLEHVARELSRMRVLVVGNYRDTDITRQSALSETLASLNRESGFERIVLRGLSRDEVAAYIRARANIEPRSQVLERIYEETEGNAFFLSEVVNLMAEEGTLTKDSVSDIAIPDGVREALGRRLNRLSQETNDLLQVAAIIGREFTYDTLTLLGERDEEELLRRIEEALDARVIEETEQPGRYRFLHAQMQETLLEELSTTRRVRLHGQVAEALERRYGDRAEERAARLALHFSEAATLAPRFTEKAAHYAALAGCQALAQSAYPDAVRHFRIALSAREGQEIDDGMAELLFDFGAACRATLEANDAWRAFRQAFDYYAQTGNVARAVDVAELVSVDMFLRETQTRMIERCLELVAEGSAEYSRLSAALGYSVGMQGDDARAQEAFRRARDIARRLGGPRLELRCLQGELSVDIFHWRPAETVAKAERAIELARQLGDPVAEFQAHFYACACGYLGDSDGARQHADQCRLLTERLRAWGPIAAATYTQALSATVRGDWQTAREALSRGLELAPRDVRHLYHAHNVAAIVGDLAVAEEYLQRLIAVADATPPSPARIFFAAYAAVVLPLHAYLTGKTDAPAAVQRWAHEVLSSPATRILVGGVHCGRALQAVIDDDQDAARVSLALLEPFSGTTFEILLATDHVRGLLFFTLGQTGEAVDAIEAALRFLAAGHGPGYAWAAYDCARIRLQRRAPEDRERARALIAESLAIAQRLGMKPLVERVLALKLQDQGVSTADIYTSIDAVARAVEQERPDVSVHAAPDGTVTIMFSDIEGSTSINERLGDRRWQELLHEHNAIIREQLRAHGGFEVKTMGDGFMVAFASAPRALECAIAVQRAFAARNERAEEPILVRIGLHTGEAIREADDFYGRDVVLASRIADAAGGSEVLVSSALKQLTEGAGEFTFCDERELAMKGLSGTHRVYAVAW